MQTDFLIVGCGILGLTLASRLQQTYPYAKITIIEKEASYGLHASGSNSGVLHAGIYYAKDSLKAQFCLKGNYLMRAYCRARNLPLAETGKVVVTKSAAELTILKTLFERSQANGARVELIDAHQLNEIEPNAKTVEQALWVHDTAVIDPKKIMQTLFDELSQHSNVKFLFNTAFISCQGKQAVLTSRGVFSYDLLINVAGAYADKVAQQFGLAKQYRSLPVKGFYRKLTKAADCEIRGNIYPVPDIRNPFLGVHFTRNIHGEIYAGPTAVPCWGRENYHGLQNIDKEIFSILKGNAKLFFSNAKFRSIVYSEPRKYWRHFFYQDAKKIVKTLEPQWLEKTNKVGIRPQLYDVRTAELVMDFKLEKGVDSLHMINAISPAFTCSWALADHLLNEHIACPGKSMPIM